jgi:peptide deformylase
MIKEIVIYPDDRINIACTDVRDFKDKDLSNLLEDLKDTIEANNLKALSAIQLGYPYNVFVIKTESGYDEYINPRILSTEGKFEAVETSSYYPNVTLNVPRYEKLKVIYEDINAKTHHKEITDREYSSLFQQMFDHLFGGTFLDKVSKEKRDAVIESMKDSGFIDAGEVCPTFSKKDYFVSFTDKLLFIIFLTLIAPFLNYFEKDTLKTFYQIDKFLFPSVIVLMIGFFFYAQYEAKKYRQCSSCQIGNNIGVIIKRVLIALLFATGAFFINKNL